MGFERLEGRALLAVDVLAAGADTAFVDMGVDPVTADVTLIGLQEEAGTDVAKVFYVNQERDSLSAAILTGLGPGTFVKRWPCRPMAISSEDGGRLFFSTRSRFRFCRRPFGTQIVR